MDQIQNDKQSGERYYALNNDWISKWCDWVQGEGKAEQPGPVDNWRIVKLLCPDKRDLPVSQSKKDGDRLQYFNVSKQLYYFFISFYGGGPIINKHQSYLKLELAEKETKQVNDEDEEELISQ